MIELRTLGEIAIVEEGHRIRLGNRKLVGLLVYLACHQGRSVRRERLGTLLWEASSSTRARRSLSNALYMLRRQIPTLRIESTVDDLYLPRSTISLDAADFREAVDQERYAEAVERYHGGFLEGFWIRGAPAFEEWQELEHDRLSRAAAYAMRRLLGDAEATGDWLRAERLADRLLELDPFDERVHVARVSAIAAGGDRDRALEESRRTTHLIREELGRDPGDALMDLVRGLESPAASTDHDDTVDDDSPVTVFTGRGPEFQALRTHWDTARSGTARCVLVIGEAGIGKTRLSHRFLRLAALQGARILSGRCQPTESHVPLSGFANVLADGVRLEDLDDLSEPWVDLIGTLFPSVCEPPARPLDLPSTDGDLLRRRAFDAVVRLLRTIGRSAPVVLFLDDVHWADDSTVALLHHLTRVLKRSPVLILLTFRPEDAPADSALDRLVHTVHDHEVRRLILDELDRESVEQMIDSFEERTAFTLPPPLRDVVVRQTGGRPFFVVEILEALRGGELTADRVMEGGPPELPGTALLTSSIEDLLRARFGRLGGVAWQVAGGLAVFGRSATIDVLQEVCELDENGVIQGLEELTHKGIVRDGAARITFTHDLLREATYRALSEVRRRCLHARAAETVSRVPEALPAPLAVHHHLAGERQLARRFALEAAEASKRVGARHETEYFLRLALENATGEDQCTGDRERLALFYYHCFRYTDAEFHFSKLEQHYREHGDQRGLFTVEMNRIAMSVENGTLSAESAIRRYEELTELAERIGDESLSAEIMRNMLIRAHNSSSKIPVQQVVGTLLRIVDTMTMTAGTADIFSTVSGITSAYRSAEEGLMYAARAVNIAESACDNLYALATALRARAVCHFLLGSLEQAHRDIESACSLAERSALGSTLDCYLALGAILLDCGDYERAEAVMGKTIEMAREEEERYKEVNIQGNLMLLHFERGDHTAACSAATELLESVRTTGHWWCEITAWAVLGLCALERGGLKEARRCGGEVERLFEGRDFWVPDISYVEMLLARLAAVEGRHATAVERLGDAIAAYEKRDVFCRSRLRLERARLLVRLDPQAAAREAGEVRALGESIGAPPLVVKADRVLARLPRVAH